MRFHAVLYAGVIASAYALQPSPTRADPDCAGPNHWAAKMTYAQLKNLDALPQGWVDYDHASSNLIASQKIGRDLYRQVFLVSYPLKGGGSEQAIAVSNASQAECSMGDVKVYRLAPVPASRDKH